MLERRGAFSGGIAEEARMDAREDRGRPTSSRIGGQETALGGKRLDSLRLLAQRFLAECAVTAARREHEDRREWNRDPSNQTHQGGRARTFRLCNLHS